MQPLVLLVEDLHWCDVSSLELLGRLIAQSATARVLLLATARPEFTPPWPARSNLTTVQLARLTKRQARDMIATLAGTELPAATLDALVARADGVPLYVEELTKAVAEPGAARGVEAIPATLADSLMARLDRLSTAKEVAQRAAVLGREFGYPLLAAVVGHGRGRPAPGARAAGRRGDRLRARRAARGDVHLQARARAGGGVRVAAQAHAPAAPRAGRRRAAGAVPRARRGRARGGGAALRGGGAAATTRSRTTGGRASGRRRRSAHEEAIGHLRRALALVATLPETRERHATELGLQMAIGAPLAAARGWTGPEYEQTYIRARVLASQIGEAPRLPLVLVALAANYYVKGDLATAAEVGQEALAAAERTGDAFDLIASHYIVGLPLLNQGHLSRALRHFEYSIETYDPGEYQNLAHHTLGLDPGVDARAHAAVCHFLLGDPDRALAVGEEAVALAKQVEFPLSLALALFWVGTVHLDRGELDRAGQRAEEVVRLSEQLGFPLHLGVGRFLLSSTRIRSGEGGDGIAELKEAMVEMAALGASLGALDTFSTLAEGFRKGGRHEEALGALGAGLAEAERHGGHGFDAELHRLQAEIVLEADGNAVAEAEALFHQALEIARRQEAKTFELRAATSLARLWQRQGKCDAARDLLAPVYEWFTEGFETRDLKDAKALLEELGS